MNRYQTIIWIDQTNVETKRQDFSKTQLKIEQY